MKNFPLFFRYINHKRGKVKNVFILNIEGSLIVEEK